MKKIDRNDYASILRIRKSDSIPYIYDVEIENPSRLKKYHSFECHLLLYPYSRQVNSKDFNFAPFEEYITDIQSNQKSAYISIQNSFAKVFGVLVGFVITLVFYLLKPDDLFSVQSIISVIGAYLVGKEIWDDIENYLITTTQKWKIRFKENHYTFRLERNSTLSLYTNYAKKQRYGKTALLPEKIDFVQNSNSQSLKMLFVKNDLKELSDSSTHIFSIHLNPDCMDKFESDGFFLGLKLCYNTRKSWFTRAVEVFQSTDNGVHGCMDKKGEFIPGKLFFRYSIHIGRLIFYRTKEMKPEPSIIEFDFLSKK